jgi:CRISPR-associated protein Csd2
MTSPNDPTVRHDFTLLVEAVDANPNGDPDLDNEPRRDPTTGHGLITDVSVKRRLRDFVLVAKDGDDRFDIQVKRGQALNTISEEARAAIPEKAEDRAEKIVEWLQNRYFDIRMFGAVLGTGNAKPRLPSLTGPVQIGMGRSVDPIETYDICITRLVVTDEKDKEKEQTMGRKWVTPYGLYVVHGTYSGILGAKSGVTEEDLDCMWQGLSGPMFDLAASTSKFGVSTRGLIVHSHETPMGNASRAAVQATTKITPNHDGAPRSFEDYTITFEDMPSKVTRTILV